MKITVTETKQVEINPKDVITQLLRVAKEEYNYIKALETILNYLK